MKKAVAIPYIIALILGVIIVVILAYWFISSGGRGTNVAKDAECRARALEYCTTKSLETIKKLGEVCDPIPDLVEFCKSVPGLGK